MQKYNDDSYAYVMLSEHARAVANQPDIKPGWQTREAWRNLNAGVRQLADTYRRVAAAIGDALVSTLRPTKPTIDGRYHPTTWTGPRGDL